MPSTLVLPIPQVRDNRLMTTYVIGDTQGCFVELTKLLEKIRFDPNKDRLWFTGDLVNRGPSSLSILRYIRELGSSVVVVQGNHDLHLQAIVFGGHAVQPTDTFQEVLAADDCEQLCQWLSEFPLLYTEAGYVLVHAGIPHIWTLSEATSFALEVQNALHVTHRREFFRHMYGDAPTIWSDSLSGVERLRVITNYFTRMRCISPDGQLNFESVLTKERCPNGYQAWFDYPMQVSEDIVFGHWASLGGSTGQPKIHAIDTGCVWGRQLTALRLPDLQRFSVFAESTE